MSEVLREGELEFDFRKAIRAERFDAEHSHRMSHCMKAVDFLVEWPDALWFVEVKDPSQSTIPDDVFGKELKRFITRLTQKKLFHEDLGPKGKDTFLYLHLMNNLPAKPIKYFVLIAIDRLDKGLLDVSSLELKQASCLPGPDHGNWAIPYITAAAVFNVGTWNQHLPDCPVHRRSPP